MHGRLERTNDFVVKFANVNGSGSASANQLFAKAILRMGVPVSPRNIFPSNIQGMSCDQVSGFMATIRSTPERAPRYPASLTRTSYQVGRP